VQPPAQLGETGAVHELAGGALVEPKIERNRQSADIRLNSTHNGHSARRSFGT
jgi:hypothetical protein